MSKTQVIVNRKHKKTHKNTNSVQGILHLDIKIVLCCRFAHAPFSWAQLHLAWEDAGQMPSSHVLFVGLQDQTPLSLSKLQQNPDLC
jgi:hypothetical protein